MTIRAGTENATKHTPGPWFIFGNGHCVGGPCGPDAINDARGASAGVAMCGMSRRGEDESRANAHLICAAPDLLEALIEARERMLGSSPAIKALIAKTDAAIAKARGK